jgi:hypothetical protein
LRVALITQEQRLFAIRNQNPDTVLQPSAVHL